MTWKTDASFHNKIGELCEEHYKSKLTKRGKPQSGKEWTLMAAFVISTETDKATQFNVVSMATGSKCIGPSKISATGETLHDSHAEVLARRAFLRYLYQEIQTVLKGDESRILCPGDNGLCALKPGVGIHFFTSHTPCGDASISPKQATEEDIGQQCSNSTHQIEPPAKRPKLHHDPHHYQPVTAQESTCNVSNQSCSSDTAVNPDIKRKSRGLEGKGEDSLASESDTHSDISGNSAKNMSQLTQKVKDTDVVNISQGDTDQTRTSDSTIFSKDSKDKSHKTLDYSAICSTVDESQRIPEDGLGVGEGVDRSNDNKAESQPSGDVNRTGAKCVPGGGQDPLKDGLGYHVVGAFRTKPGRGERTTSMACSDKMGRWNVVGVQGALIARLLEAPIYMDSVTVGGSCAFDPPSMKRALVERLSPIHPLPAGYRVNDPVIGQASTVFSHGKMQLQKETGNTGLVPSSAAIAWYASTDRGYTQDVTTHGKKLGVVKKNLHLPMARSAVCKAELFAEFGRTMVLRDELQNSVNAWDTTENYQASKKAATEYQFARDALLSSVFSTWLLTPGTFCFTLDAT